MSTESSTNNETLAVLVDKIADVSNCMLSLYKEGYVPNKKKYFKLNWYNALVDVVSNCESFDNAKLQHFINKLEVL